jgi:integrase/recombinase XerD
MAHSGSPTANSEDRMTLLFDASGRRKYLTPAQRDAFLSAAEKAPRQVFTFCGTLAYTGCRISEALGLTGARVDLTAGVVILECLKKRRRGVFRAVPVPPRYLESLNAIHDPRALADAPLWTWSRTTAWRRVKEVMAEAGICGLYATPKGVRHGFGIKATASEIPINMTQKWMGHSRLETTAIYVNAVGPEERRIAERMWS